MFITILVMKIIMVDLGLIYVLSSGSYIIITILGFMWFFSDYSVIRFIMKRKYL